MTRIYVPSGYTTKDFYFNHVTGVSNSRLNEVERWMNGELDFQFPKGAARIGNMVDAILTQPEELEADISDEERRNAMKIAAQASKDPLVRMILDKGEPQAIYTNEIEGIKTKSMLDVGLPKFRTGADFKTTAATSREGFLKAIQRFRHDRQGVFYMENADLDRFIIIGLPKQRREVWTWTLERKSEQFKEARSEISTLLYYHSLVPVEKPIN
jgi:hypothetical protein